MDQDRPVISIHYDSEKPVDLITFTNSLSRFGSYYTRFAKKSDIPLISEEYKLYISEVRKGSIEVELISAIAATAAAYGDVKLFVEFGLEFKELIKYFLGSKKKPENLDARKCNDIRTIVAPIAENPGSVANFSFGDNASPTLYFSVNSVEANAIQNRAINEIEHLKEPTREVREEVLLVWYQAENAPGAETGATSDKAVIDEIDEKPRKVYFPEKSQDLKSKMIGGDDNFFSKAYLVDVEVLVTNRRIVGYKILKLHETFDDIR